jgi:hypothetical protein
VGDRKYLNPIKYNYSSIFKSAFQKMNSHHVSVNEPVVSEILLIPVNTNITVVGAVPLSAVS